MRQLLCHLATLVTCLGLAAGPVFAQQPSAPYEIEVVAEGLEHPWSLAFLPSGELLVTERGGNLRAISQTGDISAPFAGVPEVYVQAQAGLFDVVLHPEFASNGWPKTSHLPPR